MRAPWRGETGWTGVRRGEVKQATTHKTMRGDLVDDVCPIGRIEGVVDVAYHKVESFHLGHCCPGGCQDGVKELEGGVPVVGVGDTDG